MRILFSLLSCVFVCFVGVFVVCLCMCLRWLYLLLMVCGFVIYVTCFGVDDCLCLCCVMLYGHILTISAMFLSVLYVVLLFCVVTVSLFCNRFNCLSLS